MFIHIILVLSIIAKIQTRSDESYIDKLPEEKKEEFLEKMAKKIFDDVESTESHRKASGEISDKELDVHHDFVKKIYREESQNLRKSIGGEMKDLNEEKARKNKEDNVQTNSETKDIDFNLRERNSNSSHHQQAESYTVSVEVRYDKTTNRDVNTTEKDINISEDTIEKDIQVRSIAEKVAVEHNDENLETITENIDQYEDAEMKKNSRENVTTLAIVNKSENISNSNKFKDIIVTMNDVAEKTTTKPAEVIKAAVPEHSLEANNNTNASGDDTKTTTEYTDVTAIGLEANYISINTKSSSTEGKNDYVTLHSPLIGNHLNLTTIEIYKSDTQNETHTNIKELNNSNKENNIVIIKDNIPANILIKSETVKNINKHLEFANVNTLKYKANSGIYEVVNDKYVNKNLKIKPNEDLQFKNDSNTPKTNLHSDNLKFSDPVNNMALENVSVIQKDMDDNIFIHITLRFNQFMPKLILTKNKINTKIKVEPHVSESLVTHNLLNAIKDVLMKNFDDLKKVEKIYNVKYIASNGNKLLYESMKGKNYNVIEVETNQPLFVRNQPNPNQVINKEGPHYVSIYNYSPENVYYNPKNRHGPDSEEYDRNGNTDNADNEEDARFDTFGSFVGFEVGKLRSKPMYQVVNKDVLTGEINGKESFNAHKDVKVLSDANERNFVSNYNTGDGSIKSRISAIRNILNRQKFYDKSLINLDAKNVFKDIKLDKAFKLLNIRRDEPITVKRYKNVGYINTGKGRKKLYLPFDKNKYDVKSLKVADKIYKSVARHRNILNKENDAIIHLKTKYVNKNNDLEVYEEVLKDIMIMENDDALHQYDWLGTTVDIQAAIKKFSYLIKCIQDGENIHASDLQLFKYVLNLFQVTHYPSKYVPRSFLPRNKNRKKHALIKKKGLLERVWLFKRTLVNIYVMKFEKFLEELEDSLHDLHEAIKEIASITNYKNQNWYKNLKDHYIRGEKELLEVILHLSTSRLLDLIEDSAKNGLEVNYSEYIRDHPEDYGLAKREFAFVLSVLDKIKS